MAAGESRWYSHDDVGRPDGGRGHPPIEYEPAARLAQDCIKKVEVLEYPELGMEAVWKIEVEDFPAFIVVDDKGNDFFSEVTKPVLTLQRR